MSTRAPASERSRGLRAIEIAARAGAPQFLASSPATVTWLTGLAFDDEVARSPFELQPLVLLRNEDESIMVVARREEDLAAKSGFQIVTYPEIANEHEDVAAQTFRLVAELVGSKPVAVEAWSLPHGVAALLHPVDVGAALVDARAVKDADEVARIRRSIALCDVGQGAVRAAAKAGVSELELWSEVRKAVESAARMTVPSYADLVCGIRTADLGGAPGPGIVGPTDLIMCDLFLRHEGYWGDSSSAIAVGTPSSETRVRHEKVLAALRRGIAAVQPGLLAGSLDTIIRGDMDWPHASGHGVGTTLHEAPHIVPGSPTVLEPGMVFTIEPGLYDSAGGIRLEYVVLVTADGCEVLSTHGVDYL